MKRSFFGLLSDLVVKLFTKLLLSELLAFVGFEVFFYEFGLLRLYVGINVCEINQPVGVPEYLEFFCCSSWFVFC